jgi:thioredoxin-related protein
MDRRTVLLAALALPGTAAADASTLPPATDLRSLAQQSERTQSTILLLFSTPGCPYCREVRRNYLAPRLVAGNEGTPRLLVREVDITSRAPLVGFDGGATTQAAFAARHGVTMVPVVMAFSSRGQPLAQPLVGLDRSGFYDAYLGQLIDLAERQSGR